MENLNDSLGRASKELMLKEPFYGMFLIMLNKQWSKDVPTAAVGVDGINYRLYINPEFWTDLPREKQIGLLKHELLHIGFFHLTDFDHQTHQRISNYAKDIEINQYIDSIYLPEGGLLPSSFPELDLLPKKGSNYYYDELMKALKNDTSPTLTACLKAQGEGDGITILITPDGELVLPDHSTWGEMSTDEATKKLINTHTENILKEVAEQIRKSRGTIPGEFKEIIERIETKEPPKFDWQAYLRRFTGGSTKIYTKKSRRKFSKRYEGNPGLKIKQHRHILIGIDTSGSVSTDELKEFLHEMYHISKTGTEITVVQCDTAISSVSKFNHKEDFKVTGRGGTSFQPVIDYYDEHPHKYTCLIYVTDGEAPAPTKPRGKILWVLSSKSNMNEDLPGPIIKLN